MTSTGLLAAAAVYLPDGVYLNLPEEVYFAQKRRGSTDWAKLYTQKEGWWWSSDMNPHRRPEKEDDSARTFGKALHARVLEGDAAYHERFATIPTEASVRAANPPNAQGQAMFARTVSEIEIALEQRGMNPKRMQKDALVAFARSRAPELVVWDDFQERWGKANVGKLAVSEEDVAYLDIMVDALRSHPDMGPLFTYDGTNLPMPEVSVLFTDEHGVQRRVRLDSFLPQTTIDLKTIGNPGSRPLAWAVGDHVAKLAYHVQMADHHVGRKWAYRFIRDGKIYDGTPEPDPRLSDEEREEKTKAAADRFAQQVAWIKRYPDEAPNWDYGWVFYQKPDSGKGVAPIIFPWGEDYGSELHMDGIRARREAIRIYQRCMIQFGPDKPWTRVEPLHSTREGDPNRVFLPAHVSLPYESGEEEDL